MTKKIVLSAVLAMAGMTAMAQKANFQVKVNMKNFSSDTVLVYKGRSVKLDTLLSKKDKFTYSTYIDKPVEYYFLTPGAYRGTERKMFSLICVPDEKAELVGDLTTRWDVGGSKFYQQYHEVDLMTEEAMKAPDAVSTMSDKVLAFVEQHPDYEACATLIDKVDGVEKIDKLVGTLSERVRNGRMKSYYEPIVAYAKKRAEAEEAAKKVQAAGVEASDFTLKDITGKDFTLSSLRGKYVILDFWGSWCGWCIKGMPKMKEYYEKYKGKFEIVGVDCNDSEEKWKAAVEKHQLPWLHVYNPKDSEVLGKYAIQGFPTKIVVGPDGKIVKTIVGEDPAFYTLLDELFSK